MGLQVTTSGIDTMADCQMDFILNEFTLIHGHIHELERLTGEAERLQNAWRSCKRSSSLSGTGSRVMMVFPADLASC
jgi:hypothetical protein